MILATSEKRGGFPCVLGNKMQDAWIGKPGQARCQRFSALVNGKRPIEILPLGLPCGALPLRFQIRQTAAVTELPFASYCNRYHGRTGWVVGRGPTCFRYEEFGRSEGPFFFINDAVSQEKWLPEGCPSFFFAHDSSMECWLFDRGRRSVPVLITDQPMTGPKDGQIPGLITGADDRRLERIPEAIFYRKGGPFARTSILERSREEIRDSAQLYTANGTIHPLLHFAWYVGCAKLNLVGCDGFPGTGYDDRLENRSHTHQCNAMSIRLRQEEVLTKLSLPREYLGVIPHRVKMILSLSVERAHHDGLLGWSDRLVGLFRAFGSEDISVTDEMDRSGTYWINCTWRDIDSCVGCVASDTYREAVLAGATLLSGDPARSFKVAYQAGPPLPT
jgi:hypothetical protein